MTCCVQFWHDDDDAGFDDVDGGSGLEGAILMRPWLLSTDVSEMLQFHRVTDASPFISLRNVP